MTSTARRDVAAVCLSIGRVAAKTGDVSIQARRNREADAAAVSPMTGGTSSARMFRMVEPRVETAQCGKRFKLSALHVCMTNRADLTGRI